MLQFIRTVSHMVFRIHYLSFLTSDNLRPISRYEGSHYEIGLFLKILFWQRNIFHIRHCNMKRDHKSCFITLQSLS